MEWFKRIPFIRSFFKKDDTANTPAYYQCIQLRDRAAYALFLESHLGSLNSSQSIERKLKKLRQDNSLKLYNYFKKKNKNALYPHISNYTVKKMGGENAGITHVKKIHDEDFVKYYKNSIQAIPISTSRQKHFQDNIEFYQHLATQSLKTTSQ